MVGIVPYRYNLSHPADRRRPAFAFKKLKLNYEIAQYQKFYEYLYLTIAADLSHWANYKKQFKQESKQPIVILDICDAVYADTILKNIFRSHFYFLTRRNKFYSFNYKSTIEHAMRSSDIVICGSIEQKRMIQKHCKKCEIVRDNYSEEIKNFKPNYRLKSNVINILWEGFANGNIQIFKMIRDILKGITDKKCVLHLVTDTQIYRLSGKYFPRDTREVISHLFHDTDITVNIYQWNISNLCDVANRCDLAILPIPKDKIMNLKPENKLLLLWQLQIPVITSDIPSYKRVMRETGLNYAVNSNDWTRAIDQLFNSRKERSAYLDCANNYLARNASENTIINTWTRIFENHLKI